MITKRRSVLAAILILAGFVFVPKLAAQERYVIPVPATTSTDTVWIKVGGDSAAIAEFMDDFQTSYKLNWGRFGWIFAEMDYAMKWAEGGGGNIVRDSIGPPFGFDKTIYSAADNPQNPDMVSFVSIAPTYASFPDTAPCYSCRISVIEAGVETHNEPAQIPGQGVVVFQRDTAYAVNLRLEANGGIAYSEDYQVPAIVQPPVNPVGVAGLMVVTDQDDAAYAITITWPSYVPPEGRPDAVEYRGGLRAGVEADGTYERFDPQIRQNVPDTTANISVPKADRDRWVRLFLTARERRSNCTGDCIRRWLGENPDSIFLPKR